MVLFEQDISRHGAFIDLNTPNKSFLHLASVYKSIGISNHLFHLTLYDRSLVGIDPHHTGLDLTTQGRIIAECKLNPWYYLREVARAPGIVGGADRPVDANRGIVAMWWLFMNHVTQVCIQPRQTGKSFGSDQLTNYLAEIRCTNTEMSSLTKNDKLRTKTIARIKAINKTLPGYMNNQTNKDAKNSQEFTVKALGNFLTIYLPSASPKTAHALGRGITSGINTNDEGPWQPNCHITIPVMMASGGAARDIAKENKEPYGTIFTTTAGNRGSPEGLYMYNLTHNSAQWNENMLDSKDSDELEKIIRANSKPDEGTKTPPLRVNVTMSHRKLGKTDEWLASKIEEAMATGDDIRMDFLNIWGMGSLKSPYTKKQSQTMAQSVSDPKYVDIHKKYGYIIRWYIEERDIADTVKQGVVLGSDTSECIGNDDVGLVFRNVRDGSVIGASDINLTNILDVVDWFVELALKYPEMVIIIENKSTGSTIIDGVIKALVKMGVNPFTRLYNRIVNDKETNPDLYHEMVREYSKGPSMTDFHTRYKKYFGFKTAGSGIASRHTLYSETLMSLVSKSGHLLRDNKTVNQFNSLREKNGRIDHLSKEHDDLCISTLLTEFMMTRATNTEFYGLPSKVMLDKQIPLGGVKKLSTSEQIVKNQQTNLRKQLDQLSEKYSKTNDYAKKMHVKHRLRALRRDLIVDDNDTYANLDQYLDNLERRKQDAQRQEIGIQEIMKKAIRWWDS